MVNNICTFASYNSTGMNSVKTNWIRDFINVTNADFISVQEHFKKTKSIEKYFSDEFPNSSSFVIPGFREPGQEYGRAKGGLAMLSNKSKSVRKTRIKTDSFRIQAQVITLPKTKLLWINTYMPVDPQTIMYDKEDLTNVLLEVEKVMDTADYDDVVWAGDFNWDRGRNTGFAQILENFVSKICLKDVWEKYPVNYTHIHTDLKSTSTLDRIMVNERLLSYIVDAGVMHFGDNPSRHSPIILKLNLGEIPLNVPYSISKQRRPAWYKAKEEDIDEYTASLHAKLGQIDVPESLKCQNPNCQSVQHSQERDSYMLDVLTSIIETSYAKIPLSNAGGRKWNPEKNCPMGKVIPGWKEQVEPYRQDALFWHNVWLSAGRPTTGGLHTLMAKSRNQYHYAIRRVKRMADSIRASNLFEAAQKGDVDLLKEMKKMNGKKTTSTLAESVEGKDNPEDIVEEFRAVYSSLYNSVPSAIEELKDSLDVKVDDLIEVKKVTGKIVKDAACRMKPSKSDVSGGYSSDALLNGPDSLFECLASIIRSFLIHSTVTKSLLVCASYPY